MPRAKVDRSHSEQCTRLKGYADRKVGGETKARKETFHATCWLNVLER